MAEHMPETIRLMAERLRDLCRISPSLSSVLLLAGLAFLSRWPFISHAPWEFDSVLYVLAASPETALKAGVMYLLGNYPGYLLYIWLGGQMLGGLVGDINAGFVWLNIVVSALTVAALYLLAEKLFGRFVGLVAALLLLFNPVFWLRGEVAIPYVLDGFLGVLIALLSYLVVVERREKYLAPVSIALGLAGGFRPHLLLFFGPMLLFCWVNLSWRRRLVSGVFLALSILVWFVPLTELRGGVINYFRELSAFGAGLADYYGPDKSALYNHALDLLMFGRAVAKAMTIGLLPLAYAAIRVDYRRLGAALRQKRQYQLLLIWVAPALLFSLVQHFGNEGHILTFLPFLMILSAWGLVALSQQGAMMLRRWAVGEQWLAVALTLPLLAFNLAQFFYPGTIGGRYLYYPQIQLTDQFAATVPAWVRTNYPPGSTALATLYDPVGDGVYQRLTRLHLTYWFPDYLILVMDTESPSEGIREVTLPQTVTQVLLFGNHIAEYYSEPSGRLQVQLVGDHWPMGVLQRIEREKLIYGTHFLGLR